MQYKGRCINFELWFTNEEDQDMERIYRTLEHLIKKDIDQAVADGCNTVIGLLLYEGFLYKNEDDYYSLLKRVYDYGISKGIKKFILVCGIVWDYQAELNNRNLDYEIIEFDYSAFAMWQTYKDQDIPHWHFDTNKFMFLGGVPSRPNRIKLLSKFYDAGMLTNSQAIWSFYPPQNDNDIQICRELCSNYSDAEYSQFLEINQRSVDDKYAGVAHYHKATGAEWKTEEYLQRDFFKDPNYIDPAIFNNTSISILAEGGAFEPAWDFRFFTEKAWRAVVNRHPFILVDNDMRKDFARSRGLDIFDNFFVEEYNDKDKLDGVVVNIQHFMSICKQRHEEINHVVDQNFHAYFRIINTCEQTLEYLKDRYAIPHEELSQWFRQKSFDHLFRIPDAVYS